MGLFRALARLAIVGRSVAPRPTISSISAFLALRFNSSVSKDQEKRPSLTAQIFRPDKDQITDEDLDEWLKAVKTLKEGNKQPETETELYLLEFLKPEQFLQEKFEPSEEQLAEVEKFKGTPVPLKIDPVVEHLINVIMRHGKKTKARTTVSRALYIVHLKTRQDPVRILYEALDKMGPLFDTRTEKTGFAKNRVVPFALNLRQRHRYAMNWIIEGSRNKKSNSFSVRLAEEIVNAHEGRSSGYDKRARMHKEATAQRSYLRP